MNFEDIKFGFQVLQFLLTAGVGFYVYMSNKDKVTNDRITRLEDDLEAKIDMHGERLSRLEVRVDSTPTHQDLSDIHKKINQVSDCVSRLEGEFSGAKNTLDLIHDFLLKGGK